MNLEPSVYGPKEKNSGDAIPGFKSLWDQVAGLSSLLHHLEKEVFEKPDNRVHELIKSVYRGDLDPEEDWYVKLNHIPSGAPVAEQFDAHFLAAHRQLFYFESLYNKNNTTELNRLLPSERKDFLAALHAKLLVCIVWGYWHYHVALKLQSSMRINRRNRARKAASYKATIREDSIGFMRILIRNYLKNRPTNGWPIIYDTAEIIAPRIETLLDEHGVEIHERGDDLIHRIVEMIGGDSSLKRLHQDNR